MSTLDHASEAVLRVRPLRRLTLFAALIVLTAGALAAGIVAFSSNGSGNPQPTQAQINRQLESVAGPRYGLARPAPAAPASKLTPQQQLQAVAGPRYRQPNALER